MDRERVDLLIQAMKRAMRGDEAALKQLWSANREPFDYLVPLGDLDEADRQTVHEYFQARSAKIDAAIAGIDPRWAEEHSEQMEALRRLAEGFTNGSFKKIGRGI